MHTATDCLGQMQQLNQKSRLNIQGDVHVDKAYDTGHLKSNLIY